MTKAQRHEAIRERAREAIRNLYHNATPTYPRELYGRTEEYAQEWLNDAASFEIEYLNDAGAYGHNYAKTLRAECNAGRYKSERARDFYVRAKLQHMREERERCNSLDSRSHAVNALWERIGELGKLYQWGRGGRTLAPESLVKQGGGSSFGMREDYCDDLPLAQCVDVLRIVESFNRYVEQWCASVPEQWKEHCAAEDAEERARIKSERAAKAKETRERNYWAARDVITTGAR